MSAPPLCQKFDEAFRKGEPTPSALGALRQHAAVCSVCSEKLGLWDAIDREAPSLRREWPTPDLMTRFAAALEAEKARGPEAAPVRPRRKGVWIPVAAVAALFVLSMVGLRFFEAGRGREPLGPAVTKEALLSDQSLDEVEAAEANYVRSIDKLAADARTRIENPTTPLLVSYREKLLVLDSAIAEMRTQIAANRFNSHLRRELLAMYQEKQRTLQQVMKEEKS
jgi:hypothetical protein